MEKNAVEEVANQQQQQKLKQHRYIIEKRRSILILSYFLKKNKCYFNYNFK